MKTRFLSISLFSAALMAAAAFAPVTGALAAPAQSAGYDTAATKSSTGPYDGFDGYRDESGRPLPGWQYLFYSFA